VLLLLAGIQFYVGGVVLNFPAPLLASLLIATGLFHMGLARPTWMKNSGRIKLVLAAVIALLTLNMLWVFFAGVLSEGLFALAQRRREGKFA
jgi:hypothetical protein